MWQLRGFSVLPLVGMGLGVMALPLPVLAQPNYQPNQLTIAQSPSTEPSSYILGPGDQIDIAVFEYEEFTTSETILPDGSISLPLIGSITAAGRTTDQLSRQLETQLQSLLVNPVVTINLTTPRPVLVNVAGEVRRPGPVQLGALGEGGTTLSAALVAAGGITPQANIRQVILQRYNPNGDSVPIVVNLWDAISSENALPDPILQGGDSIYVPQLLAGDSLDRRLIARSSLAPETVRVRVVGEVNAPGEVQVPPDSSLSSAVAIAGGPTTDADLEEVVFIRLNDQGQVEQQVLDLEDLNDTIQVQEGDVLVVPETGVSSVLDFAARLISPLGFIFSIFR
ncbi:MAG: polysaccharide export protein [Leptolyngbyaceae cyanobacterium SL_7_1]|nr:polysaccharide export protein [Leptolyngbyaceae cyanobacterium SL_7_1]